MLLTIDIDGEWSVRELAEVLDSLEALAGYFIDASIVRFGLYPPKVDPFDGSATLVPNTTFRDHLYLSRFSYASPGSFDVLGAAKIIEQIRLFLEFLINLWIARNDRRLDRDERHLELAHRKLELIQKIQAMQPETIDFIENGASNPILGAVLQGKITGVSARSSKNE